MKRFYLLWMYALTLAALCASSILAMFNERRLMNEIVTSESLLSTSIEDSVVLNYNADKYSRITKLVDRLRSTHRLTALALCDLTQGRKLGFPLHQGWEKLCDSEEVHHSSLSMNDATWNTYKQHQKFQYFSHPVPSEKFREIINDPNQSLVEKKEPILILVIAQDVSYLKYGWYRSFLGIFGLTWLGGMMILLLITFQVHKWVKDSFSHLHQTIRAIIAGNRPPKLETIDEPISEEINSLADKILELQCPDPNSHQFSPKYNSSNISSIDLSYNNLLLKSLIAEVGNQNLTIIANREPYIHQYNQKHKIEVIRPASGLVTALEPILRHLGGLWIAHGSGSADRETVNRQNEVAVPPHHPTYHLKRVFLTQEEELGYYYGFSNEGIWPLCHLAHTRPIFRLADWEYYKTVNQHFNDAIPDYAFSQKSLILVQDYHFALLPRMIQNRMPKSLAKIGIFWHIPWPNPETFGICPWSQELLRGMLGADVIGFHTQYHCNNFLETCNRYLEARIDWEHFSVSMDNHITQVKSFPIGINTEPVRALTDHEISDLKSKYGIHTEFVAVGVDRLDYTKGLIERIEAVERLLEKYPQYIGKFTLIQIGAPSRTHIPAYQILSDQINSAVKKVNNRFGSTFSNGLYQPVMLLNSHYEWEEIQYFYQLGNVCVVTSLHDGMNLVAKEYVWCQRPEKGSLVLSKFTGASRELTEAFIVNPYSIEELADSIAAALALSPDEKARRMIAMKEKIRNHNAFHWASDLIRALVKKEEISSPQPKELDPSNILPLAEGF